MTLPTAPATGQAGLATIPTGQPLWRIWHPSRHVAAANQPRTYSPLMRFDPHPPGRPRGYPDHLAWYGAAARG